MSSRRAKELGLKPARSNRLHRALALEPEFMGLRSDRASRQALKRRKMTIDDIDIARSNEPSRPQVHPVSFAGSVSTAVQRQAQPHGGAIALGTRSEPRARWRRFERAA